MNDKKIKKKVKRIEEYYFFIYFQYRLQLLYTMDTNPIHNWRTNYSNADQLIIL